MLNYSDQIMAHFERPRNVGQIVGADGVGEKGDAVCGDFLKVWIKVDGERISDVRFQCRGCPVAIATASIMTELAKGRTLSQAQQITSADISQAAGGLPVDKEHCSNLAAEALQKAIRDYHSGRQQKK